MPTVTTQDGVKIAYKTFGTGSQSILFMHGWGGSGAYFDEVLRYLDLSGLQAVTYDLRGHGASDKALAGYTLDNFAQDAFAVADDSKADKIVVVGFSMSAKFAQYLACVHPERIAGLILISGLTASALPFPDEVRSDWVSRAGNREKMMEVTRMFITQPVKPEIIERWGDDAVNIPAVALDETLNMCIQTDFADRVRTLHIPTLVVGGIHDTLFSPDNLRQSVVSPLTKARLAVLDANHEIPLEQPQALAAVFQGFLAGVACQQN